MALSTSLRGRARRAPPEGLQVVREKWPTRAIVSHVRRYLLKFAHGACPLSCRNAGLDSSQVMSESAKPELGAALTQLVAALESVSLDGFRLGDRALVEQALLAARAALDRATSGAEPFPQED